MAQHKRVLLGKTLDGNDVFFAQDVKAALGRFYHLFALRAHGGHKLLAVTQHAAHETRHNVRPFNVTAGCECVWHEWDQPQHRLVAGNLGESMCQLKQCSTLECVP